MRPNAAQRQSHRTAKTLVPITPHHYSFRFYGVSSPAPELRSGLWLLPAGARAYPVLRPMPCKLFLSPSAPPRGLRPRSGAPGEKSSLTACAGLSAARAAPAGVQPPPCAPLSAAAPDTIPAAVLQTAIAPFDAGAEADNKARELNRSSNPHRSSRPGSGAMERESPPVASVCMGRPGVRFRRAVSERCGPH